MGQYQNPTYYLKQNRTTVLHGFRDGIPIGAEDLGGIVGTGGQSQQKKSQNGGQPKLTESTHNASYVTVELGTV